MTNERVCIAIGVSKVGNLLPLPGAVNGAKEFAEWARTNKYEVILITDENDKEVVVCDISTIVGGLVESGDVKRLIIYFAGHGSPGYAGADCWLLSRVEKDSSEAINLNLSMRNASKSQIAQIAFFADACRSRVQDADSIGGKSIFPPRPHVRCRPPDWDKFYACQLGDRAQEVSKPEELESYGIFSKCLMEALLGRAEEATERIDEPLPALAVTSDRLADYLYEAVEHESSDTIGATVQIPEINAGWRRPNDVYRVIAPVSPSDRSLGFDSSTERQPPPQDIINARARRDRERERLAKSLFRSPGRYAFESRQGLTISGARPIRVAGTGQSDLFQQQGNWQVKGHHERPQSVLIQLCAGQWIGTSIFPDLIGTIEVGSDGVESLVYHPSANGKFEFDLGEFDALADVIRAWTALMHLGRQAPKEELIDVSEKLRRYKHVNPSLGIMAALAYMRAGKVAEIIDMAWYFQDAGQAVPFDIAYLAGADLALQGSIYRGHFFDYEKRREFEGDVAGLFPLMTETWSYLDPADQSIPEAIHRAAAELMPSLWTLLSQDGGAALADWLQEF